MVSTKNLSIFLIMVLLIVFIASIGGIASATADSGTLLKSSYTAVVLSNYPPVYVTNSSGKVEGFAIDALEYVAKKLDVSIDYLVVQDWAEIEAVLSEGLADFTPAIGITAERSQSYIYSQPIQNIPTSLFVRSDNPTLNSISDFTPEHRLAIISGSVMIENHLTLNYGHLPYTTLDNGETGLVRLLSGAIDGFIVSQHSFNNIALNIGATDKIKVAGDPLYEVTRAFMSTPENAHLIATIDLVLNDYKNSGQYIKDFNKWYGDPTPFWTVQKIALVLSAFFLTIIVIISYYYWKKKLLLDKEVLAHREKFEILFMSMTEMVVLHDLIYDDKGEAVNYRIIDSNEAYTRTTGIEHSHALNKLATEVYGTPEPPYLKEFSSVAITGFPFHFETYFEPMDRYFSVSVVAVGTDQFATISNDISDIKRSQQIIKDKNKELEQIVYVASHDLRSPLVNVDGYSREITYAIEEFENKLAAHDYEALANVVKTELPDIKDSLNHIRSSTKQMDALLTGLLKLSRSGRAAMTIKNLDMNSLVQTAVASYDFTAKEEQININVQDLPDCTGDEVQVTQVFSNLIDNSIKYRNLDNICQIVISGERKGNRVTYCIADNGIGIDPSHVDNIFELFHRLHPGRNEGEGLGLTIVKQIISRLDGKIFVESQLGIGSKFYIQLPAAKKA